MGYRLLKRFTPGPFTWVLKATREVPKRLVHEKRRTIGLRVPANPIAQNLLELLGEPIMTTTLRLPDEDEPLGDIHDIEDATGKLVDLIIDGGELRGDGSTVVDLQDGGVTITRQGAGVLEGFEE